MPAPQTLRACALAGLALALALPGSAQIATGKAKFLGNITNTAVPPAFDTYWNQITPENGGKWGTVEATRNVMNWAQLDTAYNHAKAKGYKFKEHTLVWGAQFPAWISGLSPADARAEVEEWMSLLAARYPDVWAIDVVNEPVKTVMPDSLKAGLGGNGATGWDWVITSFELARAKFPNAKLLINEYGTENDANARGQYLTIINLLKARNLIDGIGIQGHYFNLDSMSAADMKRCLDDYAATGLDIYVTELDIRGTARNEATQAAKYQELFPVIWEHPAVKGVTLWGYVQGQTWADDTFIYTNTGTERAALTWLKGYVTGTLPAVPAAPTSLAASASSSSQIGLTWTDNATNETAYKVERALASAGPWTEISNSLAAGSNSFTATGLDASTTYFFRVRATNAAGDSDYSNAASATTQAAPSTGGGGGGGTGGGGSSGGGGGGGGGGAPSHWFLLALAGAALARWRQSRR